MPETDIFSAREQPRFFGMWNGWETVSYTHLVVLRDDDKAETVRKRLEVYPEQTQPLIDYYKNQGILRTVDGTQPMDQVFDAIVEILGA